MFEFRRIYFVLSLLLFFTEILIAAFVHDRIIRPYGGDFLVVILLYCMVSSLVKFEKHTIATGVLIFSYLIELMQYFHVAALLGMEKSGIAMIIVGSSYSWTDMLAYTFGFLFVIMVETKSKVLKDI